MDVDIRAILRGATMKRMPPEALDQAAARVEEIAIDGSKSRASDPLRRAPKSRCSAWKLAEGANSLPVRSTGCLGPAKSPHAFQSGPGDKETAPRLRIEKIQYPALTSL